MAITVTAGAASVVTASSVTPALPASVNSGDLLLLLVELSSDQTATSPGYTEIYTDTSALDRFRLLKKTAGSSESAPVVTIGGSQSLVAMVIGVRGCDTATGPAQLSAIGSGSTTDTIDPPTTGSVKIGIVHVDPTSAGSVTWSGGTTGLGEGANSAFAFVSAGYKLEDTAGALTFSWSGAGTPVALIFSVAPTAGAAPVADFTATPLTGNASLAVTFTDTSTNTPTSWAWNFGDGATSTSQNPSHSYTVAGTYTVTLTATNATGSDGETKTGYISVTETIVYAAGGGITIY